MSNWRPNATSEKILDTAWEILQSVPYEVTTRWLFYQLLQAGFYKTKQDYNNKYGKLLSRARKEFYKGWQPNTLADDRRVPIERAGGYKTIDDWIQYMTAGGWQCKLDHFYHQENYIELWYEAQAMSRQFEYYTRGITLRPFSGNPSIDFKWEIAKSIEAMHQKYNKPIVILYFGDYDPAGLLIPKCAVTDIKTWCATEFEFIRCGLNQGDEIRYQIPENFDKPNCYQWEALNDETARKLITNSINKYMDQSRVTKVQQDAKKVETAFDSYVAGFTNYFYNGESGQL